MDEFKPLIRAEARVQHLISSNEICWIFSVSYYYLCLIKSSPKCSDQKKRAPAPGNKTPYLKLNTIKVNCFIRYAKYLLRMPPLPIITFSTSDFTKLYLLSEKKKISQETSFALSGKISQQTGLVTY